MFVDEKYRGFGVGTSLMQRSLEWLDEAGATTKSVVVLFENAEALNFYARFGFHPRNVSLSQKGLAIQQDPESGPRFILRELTTDEVDSGYDVYLKTFDWLNKKGFRQWLVPLPRVVYEHRQARGQNFGLFNDDTLAVILSLVRERPSHWKEKLGEEELWWLSTLATLPNFRGKKLGEKAVTEALSMLHIKGVDEVYLDCVDEDDFLPSYYQKFGFRVLARKNITYPSGHAFPMVLMKVSCIHKP